MMDFMPRLMIPRLQPRGRAAALGFTPSAAVAAARRRQVRFPSLIPPPFPPPPPAYLRLTPPRSTHRARSRRARRHRARRRRARRHRARRRRARFQAERGGSVALAQRVRLPWRRRRR